jgi:hypothetical protein
VDIDAVQQRAADLAQILLDLARRAPAFARRVAEKPALAPVRTTTALSIKPECRLATGSIWPIFSHFRAIRPQGAVASCAATMGVVDRRRGAGQATHERHG